ncbi:lysozyme inhibitor LprI family protein [Roseococcus pinisoli]|uniref:DUF1311 domain-containing protein n=1 Tax=Roseococcus pinisoli TaxID=2835040 RepID=A0ABS5QGK8_9PROT|nr:lysozyme inhibitor LprI family protein [Roseococcus pinisoli]MBS7812077.1 DUF1311 domain-containing protein [Roseococcus pinisoli]
MKTVRLIFVGLPALLAPMAAEAVECGRPVGPIDAAICASPALLAKNAALTGALQAATARDPSARTRLEQAQRDWLRARDRQCGTLPAPRLTACLDRSLTERIAALAPAPGTATLPAASLSRATIPSAGAAEVMLTVTRPGRFTIRAASPSGTALQLVDMLAGPMDWVGEPGAADGRLDALLDVGTYKLRARGAEGAAGETALSVTPFRDAAPPAVLIPGGTVSATLADGEQRGFWIVVEARRPVRIEAAGRALADLRLWRDGRDLVPLPTRTTSIQPVPGHSLTNLLATPELEPGSYLVTAYGGPARAWADGETAQPFHLRLDAGQGFAEGWLAGRIGPFGSEVLAVPGQTSQFRLGLPQPAPARLTVTTANRTASAEIAANSRQPNAWLRPGPRGEAERTITVTGQEGQAFDLRAFGEGRAVPDQPGSYLILGEAPGSGGDEAPASGLLVLRDRDGKLNLLDGAGPRIGPGQAWRARFNLSRRLRMALQVTAPGPISLTTSGVAVTPSLVPVAGERPTPRADGQSVTTWDLQPGWHLLDLVPPANASGVLDIVLGPPGLVPAEPSAALPADPVLLLGQWPLATDQRFQLVGNGMALAARPLPLDLGAAPLTMTLRPGQGLDLPVVTPREGALRAVALDGSAVNASLLAGPPRQLRIAPAPVARTLVISWRAPDRPAPLPRPATAEALPRLEAGAPQRFDLARDQERSLALHVAEGGLYRLETTGRLRTAGRLGTSFLPELEAAEGNGVGQNMLIQRYLRAGEYRLAVTAQRSSGRLGVVARPAPLVEAPPLAPGGTARAELPAGQGLALPLVIATAGRYRLDLRSLGRTIQGRLEDAEGWPLLPAGEIGVLDQELSAGRYRLVVEPVDVPSRVIARLTDLAAPEALAGHGPHELRFGQTAALEWRESPPGAERVPDRWRFRLEGAAKVRLILGDGMGATLSRMGGARIAGFAGGAPYEGTLEAGTYEVEARALGRDDRLTYTLALESDELQPDAPRQVTLPATIPFVIAEDRVVSLSTFGGAELRAVLSDSEGREIARDEGGTTDWNLSLSRPLPAGRYSLSLRGLDPVAPADARPVTGEEGEDSEPMEDSPELDRSADGEVSAEGSVELRLALPQALPDRAVALTGETLLAEDGVHRLTLPQIAPETLLLARASAGRAVVLSLEKRLGEGAWRVVATGRGQAPQLAVAAEAGASWRLSAWAEEGEATPIRVTARAVSATAQTASLVTPASVEGFPDTYVALAALEAETALTTEAGILSATAPGQPLAGSGTVLPQSRRLWLLAGAARPVALSPVAATSEAALVLTIPAGEVAMLPAAPAPRLWIASTGGAPAWMEAGRGMDVGAGSSLALAGGQPLRLRGEADAPSRLSLRAVDPTLLPAHLLEGTGLSATLVPGAALPIALPAGPHQARLDLAPGTAAILDWRGPNPVTVWTGEEAVSRLVASESGEVLLVNTGTAPAPVRLGLSADAGPLGLRPGQALRRFPGAAGSLSLPVEARPGQRLFWAGALSGRFVGAEGVISLQPGVQVTGPGRLVLTHAAGPLLAWLEGEGSSPFPAAPAQPAALPSRTALGGEAMALALDPSGPVLLHARTTAPVVLALGDAPPELFAAGAELHRYLPGAATLRLLSPQEGPLTGTLSLSTTPVLPADEGLGEAVIVSPGGTALFGFTLARQARIGLGLRATPDRVAVRLLDAAGRPLGEGVAQLRDLAPGTYLLEARVPPDSVATALRPALLGIEPRPNGPPPEIIRDYQAAAGIAPAAAPR